jgi:hypothetical protein
MPPADDLEKEVRTLLAQGEVTQLVHDQDVGGVVVMELFQQRVIRFGRNELIDHVHGGGKEHLDIGVAGRIGEAFGQEGFARPGIANENDITVGGDAVEVEERQNTGLLLLAGFMVVEVKLVALHLTVVTSTPTQSDISGHARDAHAASVVPNERAVHETTAVHAPSSNGR